MQSAAEAWAHVVHAPAGGNRGDQLVVGAHVGTSKNENPGRCGLPGFLAGRRIAFRSDRKAMSGGESRLDHLGGLEHDVRDCRCSRSWKQDCHAALLAGRHGASGPPECFPSLLLAETEGDERLLPRRSSRTSADRLRIAPRGLSRTTLNRHRAAIKPDAGQGQAAKARLGNARVTTASWRSRGPSPAAGTTRQTQRARARQR